MDRKELAGYRESGMEELIHIIKVQWFSTIVAHWNLPQ
jgi:hypothetical protein